MLAVIIAASTEEVRVWVYVPTEETGWVGRIWWLISVIFWWTHLHPTLQKRRMLIINSVIVLRITYFLIVVFLPVFRTG